MRRSFDYILTSISKQRYVHMCSAYMLTGLHAMTQSMHAGLQPFSLGLRPPLWQELLLLMLLLKKGSGLKQ